MSAEERPDAASFAALRRVGSGPAHQVSGEWTRLSTSEGPRIGKEPDRRAGLFKPEISTR